MFLLRTTSYKKNTVNKLLCEKSVSIEFLCVTFDFYELTDGYSNVVHLKC
jgi:hypothetical protein